MLKRHMLVTGGSGYLGQWVVRLARPEWEITATYLNHPVDPEKDGAGVTWRRLDVRDGAAVGALVREVQPAVIVHAAAVNPGQGTEFEETNADGTRHVARAAAAQGTRLVTISSDVIFDGERGGYVEEDPPHPVTPYARSKALAEAEVRASGAEAMIVRTSLIYGWRPRLSRSIRWMIESLRAEEPVRLFTDEVRCPIWVDNLAAAVVELAGLPATGVLHVAGAQALSRYEFGLRMLRFCGVDTSPVIPTRSRGSELHRPLDCTLDCSRARALLRTPLPGVDEVVSRLATENKRVPG